MTNPSVFVGFLSILATGCFVEGFFTQPIPCAARKEVIPIDAPRYQYYPFFVNVYRCSGGCSTNSPDTYHCSATAWNNVTGVVIDLQSRTRKVLTVLNHTSCECACVTKAQDCSENELFDEDICDCQCKYQDEPPAGCPGRFSWNQFQCKCVCARPVEFCPVNMEWSYTACGCVCTQSVVKFCQLEKKFLNASTCECEEPKTIVKTIDPGDPGKRSVETTHWRRLVLCMVGEFVVLTLLFDLILYCQYGGGIICKACHCPRKATSRNGQAVRTYTQPSIGLSASRDDSPTIDKNLL